MHTPPKIDLARLPTPLQCLKRFSTQHNLPRIWFKRDDLTDTNASGNKLRKLEFTIGQAISDGATVLITAGGVQSNHARATAVIAAQLGLKSHLILRGLPGDPADGNQLIDELVGAATTFIKPSRDVEEVFDELSKQYRAEGETPYCIPIGASDEVGLWGYINAVEELIKDFEQQNIAPEYLFSATGSGGTAGGLILGKAMHNLRTEILSINVCDDEAYFVSKIRADFRLWQSRYGDKLDVETLPINIIDGYVGPGYGKATPEVFQVIGDLARTEGIILDPVYTGKAFHGMIEELKKGHYSDARDIVFLHTGGIFGLFPQREQLMKYAVSK